MLSVRVCVCVRLAKGNMIEARRLFINALKWRKENKIDTILLEKHEVRTHTHGYHMSPDCITTLYRQVHIVG